MNGSRKRAERSRSRVTEMSMIVSRETGSGWSLRRDCRVREREAAVDDRERLAQLALADRQRRVREKVVPAHERKQPLLPEEPGQRAHLRRRPVEGRQRLERLTVPDQLDDAEQSDRSHG